MLVRAKFRVYEVKRAVFSYGEIRTVALCPVAVHDDPNSENAKLWQAAPGGKIELGCLKPDVADQFELGQEFFIDFTACPVT